MTEQPRCPECNSENGYLDGHLWVCPECGHEWVLVEDNTRLDEETKGNQVTDANGNILSNGDSVTLIKDLKVKGSSSGIKAGTKVRNIRLVEAEDGHNIACKIDGIGALF